MNKTKICNKCHTEKDITDFALNGKFRRGICKLCMSKHDTIYHKQRRPVDRVRCRNIVHSVNQYVNSTKVNKPCAICGKIYDSQLMQYDHTDRSSKIMNLSRIGGSTRSFQKAKKEIDKCILMCVYCHRKKTALECKEFAITIESKVEYKGIDARVCIRCSVSQHPDSFIICKGLKINVCHQCERERSRHKRQVAFDYANSIKSVTPCADCGLTFDPCCMDFDHLPGYKKKYGINRMCSNGTSICLIEKEIAKCEVVCAGCHMKRSYGRHQHMTRPVLGL
jgi:hypothetical protein